ncbi:YicC family protein [Lampropedia puyangensis]|uniref:YicC family protein n=1 Tax=Lampropedia puyangensis TaxID=1330072 RepID=A0A4S8F9A8_9BURK|nr:YicC/YloC family endoribonuclease [Lampropedia puyangensis]THU04080.1 YicC family protein [Lampropedia puyangensis]
MAVYSMTGYASGQGELIDGEIESVLGLEIRAVNSRFLDLTFKLSDSLKGLEPHFRQALTEQLSRGKVEVRAFLRTSKVASQSAVDVSALQHLLGQQELIQAWMPQARPLSVAEVIALQGGGRSAESEDSALEWGDAVAAQLQQCIAELKEARQTEGGRLKAVLEECIGALRVAISKATPLVPALVEQQKAKFMERWHEVLQVPVEGGAIDQHMLEQRAIAEVTAYAIRLDVAEELARLNAHLDEVQSLLDKGGVIGKRLDFLMQELHREANTLGSKSASLELSRISMDMKVLIEQMREQVQNIE